VTDKKNQEIVKSIGRRLREAAVELPPSRDIELHLEKLRRAEAQRAGGRDAATPAHPEPSGELMLAGARSTE
jgi:hypothetical protein